MTIERNFQAGHFMTGQTALRALTIAALLATGATALMPHAALAFVCDEDTAVESGGGALDGTSANNVAWRHRSKRQRWWWPEHGDRP